VLGVLFTGKFLVRIKFDMVRILIFLAKDKTNKCQGVTQYQNNFNLL
jgi:hypothetical protein